MLLNGSLLQPDISGALYWPERRLLVVADLHFEKGSAYARHGSLLPPYDSHATLEILENAVARLDPELVICLGDSFNDATAGSRLATEVRQRIRALSMQRTWHWVAGNHDPLPPSDLGGTCVESLAVGHLEFRHEPTPGPATGEICGHLHPCASVTVKGRTLRRRCFISDGACLVMPSFGAHTGGLDVSESVISDLFPGRFEVWMVGQARVRPVKGSRLYVPSRLAREGMSGKMARHTGKAGP